MRWAGIAAAMLASGCFLAPARPAKGDGGPEGGDGHAISDVSPNCPTAPTHEDFNTDNMQPCGLGGQQGTLTSTRAFGKLDILLGPNSEDSCIVTVGTHLDPLLGAFVTVANYQITGSTDELYLRLAFNGHITAIVVRGGQVELTFDDMGVGTGFAFDPAATKWLRLLRGADPHSIEGQYSSDARHRDGSVDRERVGALDVRRQDRLHARQSQLRVRQLQHLPMIRTSIIVLALCCGVARADTAAELVTKGEVLAKDRRFSEAIDTFKAADKLEPRAHHACLIALAYTRRELWTQAEIWLAACQQRATADDPVPDWFDEVTQQIAERLATANAAAISIRATPQTSRLTVSNFAPDETFEARTIHLPPGHYVIIAKAPGYADAQVVLDIVDRTERHVALTLGRPASGGGAGRGLVIAGIALGVAGAATAGWMSYEWAESRTSYEAWGDHIDNYKLARWTTIGAWTAAGACLVTGYLLLRRHDAVEAPSISVAPIAHGAMFAVGWQR